MKSNKGFTLIELLAVIVILAIIALIATPIILGVIDTAKKGSAKAAALGYVDAVEKSLMINQIDNGESKPDGTYTVGNNGGILTLTPATDPATTITVEFKGDAPADGGSIEITNGQVTNATLTFTKIIDKVVTYEDNDAEVE